MSAIEALPLSLTYQLRMETVVYTSTIVAASSIVSQARSSTTSGHQHHYSTITASDWSSCQNNIVRFDLVLIECLIVVFIKTNRIEVEVRLLKISSNIRQVVS